MPFRVVRTITLDYADEDDFLSDSEHWLIPKKTKWGWFGARKHFKHNVEIIGNVKEMRHNGNTVRVEPTDRLDTHASLGGE